MALFALAAGGSACGSDETGGGGAGGMGAGGMAAGGSGGQAGGAGGGGAKPADEHVVVLFTSDEHSHLFAFSPELDDFPISTQKGTGKLVGGVARRAAVIAKERRAAKDAGKDSILVSAGDNQMGCLPHTVFETESVDYTTMKALGYDVTTFGNHEFDFGPKALATSIQAAQQHGGLPPIVASNIHFSTSSPDDDTLAALYSKNVGDAAPVHPYRVITLKGGKKIGVLGYVGVNASHVAPNKTPVAFSELGVDPSMQADTSVVWPHLDADLQPIVDTLRNKEKVDLVIALSHGGINDTSSEAGIEAGDDWNVCRNVSGIDFIVSGHAHNADPKPIEVTNAKTKKGCLVLNGSAFGQHLGRVEFTIPGGGGDVTWDKSTQALIPIDDTTLPDATEAQAVPGIVESIENGAYLPSLLSRVTGTTVTNSTSTPGDLYFHPVGHTDFDVTDTHALLFLSADAMLAAADAWGVTSGKAT
ncbi:MAG TPA: metallophosphoesterase, partial [Minicystis sp.]|nr:metallophosphoesterase [Minicystis sp.]